MCKVLVIFRVLVRIRMHVCADTNLQASTDAPVFEQRIVTRGSDDLRHREKSGRRRRDVGSVWQIAGCRLVDDFLLLAY